MARKASLSGSAHANTVVAVSDLSGRDNGVVGSALECVCRRVDGMGSGTRLRVVELWVQSLSSRL